MTQILNFILKKDPPSESEFLEDCPEGGTIPDCEIRVDKDYTGAPPPTNTYGDLTVVHFPMQSETVDCETNVSVWMKPGCPPDTPDVVCDDVQNPTDIAQDSSETIYILDGDPPYLWEIIDGHGFSLEYESTGDLGERPDERKNSQNILYASSDSCGTARVQIVDNCQTELICEFASSLPSDFEYDWDNSGQTVVRSSSVDVFVKGGSPPYTWVVSGVGAAIHSVETYGLQNTVYTDGTSCGSATITVEDVCGTQIEGSVRCTSSGVWAELENAANGDSACGMFAGKGWDYRKLPGHTLAGYEYTKWLGGYQVYETFWVSLQGIYPEVCASGFCDTKCDKFIPNGCDVCLLPSPIACSSVKAVCGGGTFPCCYCGGGSGAWCFAVNERKLYGWRCP